MTEQEAKLKGYTKHVLIENDFFSFEALVDPDADFENMFQAFIIDEEIVDYVNGWLFEVHNM